MKAHRYALLIALIVVVSSVPAARAGDRALVRDLVNQGSTAAASSFRHGSSACEQTAVVARVACRRDVDDDYLTWLGNCLNLGSNIDQRECRREARAMRGEERSACDERREARIEFCELLDEDRYDPAIDPADFMTPAEIADDPNPYFPLVPGNEWVYENEEETITVIVQEETFEILGIDCVVVRDLVALTESGELIEDTLDWYTQDLEGNIWYFGEIAKNYEDGLLTDLDGSWTSGEEFAKPGISIPRNPYPGMVYRQEFLLREAEDGAQVVRIDASESTGPVNCDGSCLQTLEFTPIEPDVAEHKFYAPGIGPILEVDLENGDRTELVSYSSALP